MFFDKLFDSVNGNFSKPVRGKIYRSAVTLKSPHHTLWQKSLPTLKSMRFIGQRVGIVPSLTSWIKTIEAFQQITKKLHNLGVRSLLLRNFNQDPLENFFGAIRAHGHSNIMPSSASFEASYKALLINNIVSPKSVGANCEKDDNYSLQNLKYLLTCKNVHSQNIKENEIDINHLNLELLNVDEFLGRKSPEDIEKCAAAAYCCGWLIKLNKKYVRDCEGCKEDLEGRKEDNFSKFINLKKNTEKCVLYYPNKNLLEFFLNVENITISILTTNCQSTQILEYIKLICTTLVTMNFIKCEEHKNITSNLILNKAITLIINDWCKEVNGLLSGKVVDCDQNDPIKNSAKQYFYKNKTKKRTRKSGEIINL